MVLLSWADKFFICPATNAFFQILWFRCSYEYKIWFISCSYEYKIWIQYFIIPATLLDCPHARAERHSFSVIKRGLFLIPLLPHAVITACFIWPPFYSLSPFWHSQAANSRAVPLPPTPHTARVTRSATHTHKEPSIDDNRNIMDFGLVLSTNVDPKNLKICWKSVSRNFFYPLA